MLETGNFYFESLICDKCHLPYWDDMKSTCVKQICKCNEEILNKHTPLMGWICPACGGGVAPGITRCPCVPYTFPVTVFPNIQPIEPYTQPYLSPSWPLPWVISTDKTTFTYNPDSSIVIGGNQCIVK